MAAVTKEDLLRVAKKYLDLDHLAIVIVGDRASIEEPLKATKIAPITILDVDGNAALGGGGSGNKRRRAHKVRSTLDSVIGGAHV